MVGQGIQPEIAAPKPDRTFGWSYKAFASHIDDIRALGVHACPILTEPLVFPIFAIEIKGAQGALEVARLQNLHNGATMLSNLLYLRRNSGNMQEKMKEFFNKIYVLSFEITAENIQMSGY